MFLRLSNRQIKTTQGMGSPSGGRWGVECGRWGVRWCRAQREGEGWGDPRDA